MDKPPQEVRSLQHHGQDTVSPARFLSTLTTLMLLVEDKLTSLKAAISKSEHKQPFSNFGGSIDQGCSYHKFEASGGVTLQATHIRNTTACSSKFVNCAVEEGKYIGGIYEESALTGSKFSTLLRLYWLYIKILKDRYQHDEDHCQKLCCGRESV